MNHPFIQKMFFTKIKAKSYTIQIVALMLLGIGFIFSASNFAYNISLYSPSYFHYLLIPAWTGITLFYSTSLLVRRVRDIVYDTSPIPYIIGAFLLSLIPVLGYGVVIALMILPSNYLTTQRQAELLAKLK